MPSTDDLTLYQWGIETVNGTAVPATSKIAIPRISFEPTDAMYRPRLAKGINVRNRGNETLVSRGTRIVVPSSPWNYEQGANWLSMSVAGGSANTPTGTNPYVYTYARSLTADPDVDSWTLERRMGDFAGNRDEEYAYAMLSKIGWSFTMGEALMFNAEGFARKRGASTLTAAQTMPAVEIPSAALVKVWMDGTWANLGTTQVTGQVLSGGLDFSTGYMPLTTADGRTDQDFVRHILNGEQVQIAARLVILCETQYDAEKTAAEALSLRALRIQVDGASSKQLQLDAMLKHEQPTVPMVEAQNGQWIVTLVFQEATDGTNLFRAKLTNTVATIV